MSRIIILGANGHVARHVLPRLLRRSDAEVTLLLRRAQRLENPDPSRVSVVEGDVVDTDHLSQSMAGHDIVYANLAGNMAMQARSIIEAMHRDGLKRLVFISSMGIYGEVPGERYRSVLDPYRDSAKLIEASDLDYTILRPGWFVNGPGEVVLTGRHEPFTGHDVSLDGLADLIVDILTGPTLHVRESLGVSTP
jgi:uncharacterized protein YbjT (DUF2867 family)